MKLESSKYLASKVEALRQGDEAAFDAIYLFFEPKLYAFAFKLARNTDDAEEIVQEVFMKVWEKRHNLDPDQNFDSYLFAIAKNIVYNRAKRKAYEFAFTQYLVEQKGTTDQVREEVEFEELSDLLEDICDKLPPVRKKVFIMSRVEGKSNAEIAQILKTSNSNIENHINKALKFIREKFKQHQVTYLLLFLLSLLR